MDTVRRNTTIDWTVKESVRAKLRILVKHILRKHGYPPDKADLARTGSDDACYSGMRPIQRHFARVESIA